MKTELKVITDAVFTVLLVCAAIVTVVMLLTACTTSSRQWRANTSFDVGFGGETGAIRDGYGYLGASYYLDYGVSTAAGLWGSPYATWGPYWGINYSVVPFE